MTATAHDLGPGVSRAVDGSIVVGETGSNRNRAFAYDLSAPSPHMVDLGDLGGGNATATAIDGNIVVGQSETANAFPHPFAYDLGAANPKMLDLGTLGGTEGGATAVNGTVVTGWAETATRETHPFAYDLAAADPRMVDLGLLGGRRAGAAAVDGSVIVGTSDSADGSAPPSDEGDGGFHAFVYDLGADTPTMRDIGTAGQDSDATDVSGPIVVGDFDTPKSDFHAYAYNMRAATPRMRDLGTLGGGPSSSANAVDGNLVVGGSERPSGNVRAFAYDLSAATPRMQGLGTLGGDFSRADAVSGKIVVGEAAMPGLSPISLESGYNHAFAYDVGTSEIVDLDPNEDGNSEAVDVDGNIVAGTTFDDGQSHATAWTLSRTTLPAIRFSKISYHVQENVPTATITVTRAGDPTPMVDAMLHVQSNSADGGEDFHNYSTAVTFAPGETEKSFTVRIFDDTVAEGPETILLQLDQPGGSAILGTSRVAGLVIDASDQQPDAMVSTKSSSGYIGDNVYNTTGTGQTKTVSARRAHKRVFSVRIHNDGTAPDTMSLHGSASPPRSTVRYFRGATDVTAAMRSAAGLRFHLRPDDPDGFIPDQFGQVRVETTVGPHAAIGSRKSASVTGKWTGDGTRMDLVKTVVKVIR